MIFTRLQVSLHDLPSIYTIKGYIASFIKNDVKKTRYKIRWTNSMEKSELIPKSCTLL